MFVSYAYVVNRFADGRVRNFPGSWAVLGEFPHPMFSPIRVCRSQSTFKVYRMSKSRSSHPHNCFCQETRSDANQGLLHERASLRSLPHTQSGTDRQHNRSCQGDSMGCTYGDGIELLGAAQYQRSTHKVSTLLTAKPNKSAESYMMASSSIRLK